MVKKGFKYGFLVLVLEQAQYGRVKENETVQWTTSDDPGGYEDNIQAKNLLFGRSKSEKKHARTVTEYKKF